MSILEQVICKDGRIIRLAPWNVFPDQEAMKCRRLRLKPKDGFYIECTDGFWAADVTALWDRRQS